MLKLFKKELALNVHPALYLFALFGLMVLIPNYPYIVAAGYIVLQIFNYLMASNQNLSMQFTSMLPTKRSDTVRAVSLVIILFELLNFAVIALCLLPSKLLFPDGNLVGLDANLTLLGVVLLCFGAFNLAFLPNYFKTCYKVGVPTLLGLLAFLATYAVCETLVQALPVLTKALDGYATETLWARAVVLAVGIVLFVGANLAAIKISVKKFEKVNL